MNGLLTRLLGGTPGAGTSEARLAAATFLVGLGLILAGDIPSGVSLLIGAVASFCGARGLTKAGQAVGQVSAALQRQRLEVAKQAADEALLYPPKT